ncbi:MAG: hypothetical protein FWG72_06715 [Oscillospiraceae bacterium]|nr:hypothetical protein [Oscillospiraceae bacterium]
MECISKKDRQILRDLAAKQMELAHSPQTAKLRDEWTLHGTFDSASRPMILIETGTFQNDVILKLMRCEGKEARELERELLMGVVNHTLFGDDTVVKDYVPVIPHRYFVPFGIEVKQERAGESLGHQFIHVINDLEQDFHKFGKSRFGINWEDTLRELDCKNEVYGDILPVRKAGFSLYCCLTQDIVHIMKMEDMFTAMFDYPELFHQMMSMLVNDYLEFFDLLETENALLPTYDECHLSQGSYSFNGELPRQGTDIKTTDIWGFLDSQETSGISPAMFAEHIAPHYRRIAERYGLLSYGCCEAVDPVWDCFLSGLDNLRKVSVSPWANEDFMGEKLRGKNIVYMRKPTSNLLGLGSALDEQAVMEHIGRTVAAAKGCYLEIIQRDVYQIQNTPDKVRRYVELVRVCCEKHF